MKFIWDKSEIRTGRIILRRHREDMDNFRPTLHTAKHTYKIGWNCHDENQYCLIAMSDGMICATGNTKETLAAYLNERNFIPLTHEQFIAIMNCQPLLNANGN